MEEQARQLLAVLTQSQVAVDTKLDLIDRLKSHIKHHAVPESAVGPTFDVIRTSLSYSQLQDSAFSVLSHMTKRMLLQHQHDLLAAEASDTYPAMLDRLGDVRDRTQARAVQALSDLWQVAPQEVESLVREQALNHATKPRARKGGMQWVLRAHKDHNLPFKTFVPRLVQSLDDPDSGVQDTARGVLIELFRNASDPAKADLQKQLARSGTDGASVDSILAAIGQKTSRPPSSMDSRGHEKMSASTQSARTVASHSSTSLKDSTGAPRSKKGAPVPPGIDSADALPQPVPASTKAELDPAKPIKIGPNGQFLLTKHLTADNKDTLIKLDDIVREFQPAFEGRESEQNWPLRDKHILALRKLNQGNAPTDFTAPFIAQIKGLREGILKAVNSLRTTPSTNACYLVQELARTLGSGLDPMVEVFMETLIKLSGHTKAISAQNGNVTIATLYNHVSYNKNLLLHTTSASQDKNVRPRGFAQAWLRAIIGRHINHKHVLEHGNGAETIEKIVRKGLADSDPSVRESARETFWVFNPLWPSRGEVLMASLSTTAQSQLLQHHANPDKSQAATKVTTSKAALSKSTNAASRPTLKEMMLAKKREKERTERPASAMAQTSPVRSQPARPQSSLATGTLSSAPLRPARPKSARRPEPAKPESPKMSVKGAARKPLAHSPAKISSPTKADEDITLITSTALAHSNDLHSRPKTSDSNSSRPHTAESTSSTSLSASRILEPAFVPEPSPSPKIERHQDSYSAPEAAASLQDEDLGADQIEDQEPATPMEKSPMNDPVPVTPPIQKEERKPEPIVIRDDEQDQPTPVSSTPILSPAQKESEKSTEPRSKAETGSRPLAELSESQTNNVNDPSSPSTMRLIDSGIKRISSKTLDAHGFRKLQSTINSNMEALSSDKLEQLVRAVVPQIGDDVSPSDDRILTQQLLLLKSLSKAKKVPISIYMPDVITSVLIAMGRYDEQSHTQVTLESALDEFTGMPEVPLQRMLDAALDLVTRKQPDGNAQGVRTLGHALDGVKKLLRVRRESTNNVATEGLEPVLQAALSGVKNMDASIRQKSYSLAVEVYKASADQDKFWADVDELPHSDKAMLHYYVMQK